MKRKLKNSSGFSLVEMLCATAVLMLLCVMLNSGLSVTMKTYFDLTAEAETQLLLNSLTNAVAGELRYAFEVSGGGDANKSPTYNDGLYLDWSSGQVLVKGGNDGDKELLPKEKDGTDRGGAYKNGEYQVEDMEIAYDRDTACFTLNLTVGCKSSGIRAEAKNVVIRCLNPPEKEGTTP